MIIEIEIDGYVAFLLIVNLLAFVLGYLFAPALFEWYYAKRQLKRWDEEERRQKEAQPE